MTLLADVEVFLKRTGVAEGRFGREACNDPALVSGLRNGRQPRELVEQRVREHMARWQPEQANACPCGAPIGRASVRCRTCVAKATGERRAREAALPPRRVTPEELGCASLLRATLAHFARRATETDRDLIDAGARLNAGFPL